MKSGALKRITVTGSESTGKTWLAARLAHHFETVWVPEFAREYVKQKAAPLDASDVEPIAHGQIKLEDTILSRAHDLAVLDTDLVSTVVYAEHYYGMCPAWIERAARERLAHHYLLCDVDVPWVPDVARDRPDAREEIHAAFAQRLDRYGATRTLVRGTWEQRAATAISAIESLLASPGRPA
ncbi:MAG TPA: ATP-binding protein [Gemmatimonadaceae bacterium]|nr:ATP-binding protein [Gemmatimonadaceae bacterium]